MGSGILVALSLGNFQAATAFGQLRGVQWRKMQLSDTNN
jgi:hypothetical protein